MIARARNADGFTLPELLVTISIALIISLAAFSLVEVTMRRTGETTARIDALQRGRTALDLLTRQLRSQVCVRRSDLPGMIVPRSIEAGSKTSVTFYAGMGDPSATAAPTAPLAPDRRSLSLEARAIVERRWSGAASASDATQYSYPATPASTRTLLEDTVQDQPVGAPQPTALFRYFAYDAPAYPSPDQELVPNPDLTVAQLQRVARIQITYRALPTRAAANARASTVFLDDVSFRGADPNAEPKELNNPCT